MRYKTSASYLVRCFSAALILAAVVWYSNADRRSYSNSQSRPLSFPFKVMDEQHRMGKSPFSKVRILLLPEHYSKENLDKLFLWYSKQSPNLEEFLTALVYTDMANLRLHKEMEDKGIGFIKGENPPFPQTESLPRGQLLYDAYFRREAQVDYLGRGGNLIYHYCPDLNKPLETKTVVLRGKAPFARQKIIGTWETSNNNLRIQITSYELEGGIEPSGIYHTFGYALTPTADPSDIFTVRLDNIATAPQEKVRFISNEISYAFMGWIFAATTNGGKTWFQWDAEWSLPRWQCCNSELIRDVQISQDGSGTMTLGSYPRRGATSILHTKDYGRHWKAE